MITKDIKISRLLAEHPQTLEVLDKFSSHFDKSNNKIQWKVIASRVNVEQAAGIAGVDVARLLSELNDSINANYNAPEISINKKEAMKTIVKPEKLKDIRAEKILQLDVRPAINSGKDPFLEIMTTIKSLKEDEVLHLINSFEPIPLYSVLENKGYKHWTENDGNTFNVFFYKEGEAQIDSAKAATNNKNIDKDFENVIELDVRELAPPEPMMKILENISRVDDKTIMLVHHHRDPMMLYPKLEERGYSAVANKINENYYKVVITKQKRE